MELTVGQLIIILAPYIEQETYTNIKAINDDSIILTVRSSNILKPGKDILCIAIDGSDIYEFYSVIEESFDNTAYIRKPIKNGMSYAEKRRFNRMDCDIGFVGRPVMINDIIMTSSDKQFSGMVKNISAGGVGISTTLKLPEFMIFKFKLKLHYFMDCTAMVRRTSESKEKGLFESGCEFMEMPLEDIKTISLFVFREQLRMRRKELNKTMTGK